MNKKNKLCVVIPGPSFEEARQQIEKARASADLLEFRVDLFQFSEQKLLQQLREISSLPVIFTLRHIFDGNHTEYLKHLLSLKPEYIDIEWNVAPEIFKNIQQQLPEVQLICSLHDFEKTTPDLESLFQKMLLCPAHIYKIATMARSSLDAMRMLQFIRDQVQKGRKIIGICLGENGQLTRIVGTIFGNEFTYASLDASCRTAPGQVDADVLINTYHCRKLNQSTRIFGLIGDPVEFSRSHQTHNATMQRLELNAVYVKIKLIAEEVKEFLTYAKNLGFQGFSVTMPLKEVVRNHIDACRGIAAEVGAINTIALSPKEKVGYNTDGEAVAELLQEKLTLHNARVILLGAGGAAKAIACALYKQGAKMIFLNRTLEKAKDLATEYKGESYSLSHFSVVAEQGYDILVNCTSIGMTSTPGSPITLSDLLPNRIVMDIISHPKETPLLAAAKQKNCITIPGEAMFLRQAEKQFSLWFNLQNNLL